jgi:hypothetical protein
MVGFEQRLKWDTNALKWNRNMTDNEKLSAFTIVDFGEVKNNDSDNYDYLVVCDGCTVKYYTDRPEAISESKTNIDNIKKVLKRSKHNYRLKLILIDGDAPLNEDAKLFAEYIDYLASKSLTNSINILGFSKCGVMSFNMPKYYQNPISYHKTNLYTIATPFEGTMMATPNILLKDFSENVHKSIHNERLANLIISSINKRYSNSNDQKHHRFNDISIPNKLDAHTTNNYDPELLQSIFSKANLSAIKRLNTYQNICTRIDDNTFEECLRTANFIGLGLCLTNDFLLHKQADGMVEQNSQQAIEKHLDISSPLLKSSHHAVLTNQRLTSDLIHYVDDTIGEQVDKCLVKKFY